MCADVMALSNVLVYGDQLRCATEGVASSTLHLPLPNRIPTIAKAGALQAELTTWANAMPTGSPSVRLVEWLDACLQAGSPPAPPPAMLEDALHTLPSSLVPVSSRAHSPVVTIAVETCSGRTPSLPCSGRTNSLSPSPPPPPPAG